MPWSGRDGAPVTIGRYGPGARPVIEDGRVQVEVRGDWVSIDGLHVRADAPTTDAGCGGAPAGRTIGILFADGSRHGLVRDALVTDLFIGLRVSRHAGDVRILESIFRDNDVKSDDPTSDAGGIAIDLQGDDNEVAWNHISGSETCSRFFDGLDGSAVSVFGGRRNVIHHNVSIDDHDFVEVGDARSQDTLVAYNVVRSSRRDANFLVVHGVGSRYGPTLRTRAWHNTAVMTGGGTLLGCGGSVGPEHLSLRGNVLWSEGPLSRCFEAFDEGDNLYWRSDGAPEIRHPIDASSRVLDPRLVDPLGTDPPAADPAVPNGPSAVPLVADLRLLPDSPAIDAIEPLGLGDIGALDAGGMVVPYGYGPDIGASEWAPQPAPSPAASPGASPGPSPGASPAPSPGPSPGAGVAPPAPRGG